MQRIILWGLISMCLFQQAGCRTEIVGGNRLERMADIPRMRHDIVSSNSETEPPPGTNPQAGQHVSTRSQTGEPCRIGFHPSHAANRWMVVEGRLNNGRKYPVILDTGASVALFVNDVHILENKLPINPIKRSSDDSAGWGRCRLPRLQLASVALEGWPCFYREQHTEVRLFGISLAKDRAIIAGLPLLRNFRYVMFDSVAKEVELSRDKTFYPNDPATWDQYPMRIEEAPGGNAFLFVRIPVNGQDIELQLDTGSGKGLTISEAEWKKMSYGIQQAKLGTGRDLYPYVGLLPCRKAIVTELDVGGRTIRNARVSIFPNDSPIVGGCSGLLGMQFFQHSVVVLDFAGELMWVKNPPKP